MLQLEQDSVISCELQFLESLNGILVIGEPKLIKLTSANLDGNSSFHEPRAHSASEASTGSLSCEDTQIISQVFDKPIDAYRDDAFESELQILLETENQVSKQQVDLESLDDILAIGEPQLEEPTLATLDENSSLNEPSATSVLEESPGSLADQGKHNIRHVFDELSDAYRDEAFQAQLQILFEAENKVRKLQAKAPAVRSKGAAHVKGRDDLCKKVWRAILPRHDFLGIEDGSLAFCLAVRPYYNDFDVQEKMRMIDSLVGLPLGATFGDFRSLLKLHQPHLKIEPIFGT